ncbi:acyl-CoA/acyl-ACP dehydrogenase [Labedella endophytica]|uniref:Acyl-CoA dehydrogenase n=1 Tax=Labedella endophytica TaxID=1523160 RepID=A0A3S0X9R4_9MICO|nr:acyl-CoA/acyl-ACP dehydrogenase [Labedella endophytica]RUR03185.1 acyl-CoA dehydrogenase [Labedella endophytica]
MTGAVTASTSWPGGGLDGAEVGALRAAAADAAGSVERALEVAGLARHTIGPLEQGNAGRFFVGLGALADGDVTVARVVEPHLDALGILAQAGMPVPDDAARFGVFAAEAPGLRLDARRAGPAESPELPAWRVTGRKPWCSLASRLSDALLTAHTPSGERRLFRVSLRDPGVTTNDELWVSRGMPLVPSGPIDLADVPAEPVGEAGWYLDRPGFAWGGIGVAACWWGGAIGLVDALHAHAERKPDSELALAALGASAVDLAAAENAVAEAARAIESGDAAGRRGAAIAQRVRSTVRGRVDAIRTRAVATLGPAPLTVDEPYLTRVSDLELYVQQDHGERDLARLGRLILDGAL